MVRRQTLHLNWLFLGSLITNTGISFIWPLTTIYMHEYLHESLTVSAAVLFCNSLAMMIGNYVGGRLFDRWKPYPTILMGIGLAALTSGCLIVWHGWPAYPLFLVAMGFGNGIVITSVNSYATLATSRRPSFVFNVLYFTSNLGLVIGTLIVGFVLPHGISYIFALACLLFSLFFVVALLHFNVEKPARVKAAAAAGAPEVAPYRLNVALLLTVLFITWIAYEQWQSNISAFMLTPQIGLTVRDYSFLWTVNASLIVLGQPILTAFDDWLLRHIRLRLTAGFTLFASSFLVLIVATHYWQFILAISILTIGEILALPAVSTYVDLYSPRNQKGRYQGFVQMFASAGRAVGPLIGALLIEALSYHVLFFMLFVALLTAVLIFTLRAAAVHLPTK
ncbi:MDR family MFS transporter [Lacticaseibacillus mingshuiensis]|uniref:MDR family MFS transporter n=1 Tax=Lacticaseibacillus mingshuiensis TaxID=2799574 RepID=A0ABW4CJ34_9LACO|nr:MFS transporter [Lacticaseibacillus mingshuiensis]